MRRMQRTDRMCLLYYLLTGLLMNVVCTAAYALEETAEENTSITITCPVANIDYSYRSWYRGYFTATTPAPTPEQTLFTQVPGGLNKANSRADMSLGIETFSMTIGQVQLDDDGFFSCKVFSNLDLSSYYNQTRVYTYIKPTIELTGLNPTHKENETVTVACTIDRLYPPIQPANFTMRWGDTMIPAIHRNNSDGSFAYRVEITKTLTKEDNGMTVTCNVNPVRGTPVSEQRTLNVHLPSASKSNIVPAAVGGTLGVLTTIVIIIIVIVVMYYRRNRKKGGTVQPAVVKDDGYLTPVPLSDNSVYNEIIEPAANTNRDQQDASHQPCAEIYEEIEDHPNKPQTGFQGPHRAHQRSLHDYESLLHDKKWKFEVWVQENELPPVIIARLQKEELVTLKPLQKLSKDDLAELGLPMGHRVILKDALKNLMKQLE